LQAAHSSVGAQQPRLRVRVDPSCGATAAAEFICRGAAACGLQHEPHCYIYIYVLYIYIYYSYTMNQCVTLAGGPLISQGATAAARISRPGAAAPRLRREPNSYIYTCIVYIYICYSYTMNQSVTLAGRPRIISRSATAADQISRPGPAAPRLRREPNSYICTCIIYIYIYIRYSYTMN